MSRHAKPSLQVRAIDSRERSAEIAEDSALQATLEELRGPIVSLSQLAAAGAAASGAGGQAQEKVVSLSRFLWLFVDRGLVKETKLRNTALGVLPPPDGLRRYFTVALTKENVHTAFLKSGWGWSSLAPRDEVGGHAGRNAKEGGGAPAGGAASGLGIEDFLEALVRCADVAWREVRLMERSRRLRALVRCLLKQATEEVRGARGSRRGERGEEVRGAGGRRSG